MTENQKENESYNQGSEISGNLLVLLFLGLGILIIGVIVIFVSSAVGGSSFGGIIFIGPFPIVFGTGPNAIWLIVLSIIIAVVMLALFFIMRRRI